jgi:hypothetical protein
MSEKLIDCEASIDADDDGDVFVEMIFANGRVGLTFGHDLRNTGVFSTGKPRDETTRLFNAPQSDAEANAIREHFVKLLELFPAKPSDATLPSIVRDE